jgi:hypothetical protein
MVLDPPNPPVQFADRDAVAHDRRVVLGDGLPETGLTVLQMLQLAVVPVEQQRVLVQNAGVVIQNAGMLVHSLTPTFVARLTYPRARLPAITLPNSLRLPATLYNPQRSGRGADSRGRAIDECQGSQLR